MKLNNYHNSDEEEGGISKRLVFTLLVLLTLALLTSCSKEDEETDTLYMGMDTTDEPTQQAPEVFEPFTYVQIADTQLGFDDYDKDLATYLKVIDKINSMDNVAFVLVCGDLVNEYGKGSVMDFKTATKKFNMPVHLVAGNHDVENKPTHKTIDRYRKDIGPDYYTFTYNGIDFTGVNTQLWKSPVSGYSGEHDAFFKDAMQKNSRRKIVFGHYPMYVRDVNEPEGYYNLPVGKRMELLSLMSTNGVESYQSGHTHSYVENEYKGMKLVSAKAITKNGYRRNGFEVWNITADGSEHHTVSTENILNE